MVVSEELLGGFWLYHIIRETDRLILILVIGAEDGYKEGDNHYDPTAPTRKNPSTVSAVGCYIYIDKQLADTWC